MLHGSRHKSENRRGYANTKYSACANLRQIILKTPFHADTPIRFLPHAEDLRENLHGFQTGPDVFYCSFNKIRFIKLG